MACITKINVRQLTKSGKLTLLFYSKENTIKAHGVSGETYKSETITETRSISPKASLHLQYRSAFILLRLQRKQHVRLITASLIKSQQRLFLVLNTFD